MRSWKKPTPEIVDRALACPREAERRFFFSKLENPLWISELAVRGCFLRPPTPVKAEKGYVQYPGWPELSYLVRMAPYAGNEVARIIGELPATDNFTVYSEILKAIAQIPDSKFSVSLLGKALEAARLAYRFSSQDFISVISHWNKMGTEGQIASLRLVNELISFVPDSKAQLKIEARKANPQDFSTALDPMPKFEDWDYHEILENAVRPLVLVAPVETAEILIRVVKRLLGFSHHPREAAENKWNELSELWCPRVDHATRGHPDSKEYLIAILTFACERVFETHAALIPRLDEALRRGRWQVFSRIRQHLYAKFPSDLTLPWIREVILAHQDYAAWEHHFEFQKMISAASLKFGESLLTIEERQRIFDAILSGPSVQHFKESAGASFDEALFKKRQRYFHLKQLKPFGNILLPAQRIYLEELLEEHAKSLSDDDYSPFMSEGVKTGENRSPKPVGELQTMSDADLLVFLNVWEEVHRDPEKWWIDVNFEGLGRAFHELIISDIGRFAAWGERWKQVRRPFFFRSLFEALRKLNQTKTIVDLGPWFTLGEWILNHDEQPRNNEEKTWDTSSESPSWRSARRALIDFVESCVSKEASVPIVWRPQIQGLLEKLCTGYDRNLELDSRVFSNQNDPLTEAINTTRGRALETLVDYGWWVRRSHGSAGPIPEVFAMLDQRFSGRPPLTSPEHALLAVQFIRIYGLDPGWASLNASKIFLRAELANWKSAFVAFLAYGRPYSEIFILVKGEFEFAFANTELLKSKPGSRHDILSKAGDYLICYYVWDLIPLEGALLGEFYRKTEPKHWAQNFDHVGRMLKNSTAPLDDAVLHRILAFFEARLRAANKIELKEFSFWLASDCLDAKWKLEAFSKILDVIRGEPTRSYSQVDSLCALLSEQPDLVVECFDKLIRNLADQDHFYLQPEEVLPILRYGLNSDNEASKAAATRAREKLLRLGRFEFLDP